MRPLRRSISLVSVLFFAALSLILSYATYRIYTSTMLGRYQKQMTSILDYVERHIDHEDMSECARTYVESEKYRQFQAFFDEFIDCYEDVHYLYILKVEDPEAAINIRDICSANSTYEKENEPDMVLHLGDGEEGWYDAETARAFLAIQQGDEDVFYTNPSQWGVDYTLARPLVNAAGEHYGVLCADVSIDEINAVVYRNIYINIGVIVVAGCLFILLLLLWMRRNVTKPLNQLEKSVTEYAGGSAGKRDPEDLVFEAPRLKVHNEVQSLSQAVVKLSEDMRDYAKGLVAAENESEGLKTQAYRDALTKVKNKAAYDIVSESLDRDAANNVAEFGIVMVDLNHLKAINDRYGHERGNEYIVGSSGIVCDEFSHSPVFRIGGDEFAVILQGDDYYRREILCAELKERFRLSAENELVDPWKRYSAAVGMSVYKTGDTVEAVFKRADQAMYEEKSRQRTIRAEGIAAHRGAKGE